MLNILSLLGIFFLTALAVIPSDSTENKCPEIDVNNVVKHLQALDVIATQNQGNRAAATQGYQRSVEYILTALAQTNFKVWLQDFTITQFRIIGQPSFSQREPVVQEYTYLTDFRVMTNSGSGSVNALVTKVPNIGCNAQDFANFPAGNIAVVLRGECPFTQKAQLAEAARASAIIIYNTATDNGGGLFSGSAESNLPVLSISHWLGLVLTEEGKTVRLTLDVRTEKTVSYTTNVLAETITGNPDQVVLVGSHLDGVTAGPGINDNGSGTSTNLEMALTVFRCFVPKNKIRFAWWGAEELGLLGSTHYVNDLVQNNPDELKKIALNINIDMIGSPNFFFGIYNGSSASQEIREKCTLIQLEFEKYFVSQRLPYALTAFDGRSDYGPFIEEGIPAGGLFTGAETVKNSTGRSIFGGLANTAYDPCYHGYCDSIDNISLGALTPMVNAAYTVLTTLSNSVDLVKAISSHKNHTTSKPFTYPKHPDAISRY